MSDKKKVGGELERKSYGVLTKYRAALHYYYGDQGKVLKGAHVYSNISKFLRSISAKDAKKRAAGVIISKAKKPLPKKAYLRIGTCTPRHKMRRRARFLRSRGSRA